MDDGGSSLAFGRMCLHAHETPASFSMWDAKVTREITRRKGHSLYAPRKGQASQPLTGAHIREGGMREIGNGFWASAGSHRFKDIYM